MGHQQTMHDLARLLASQLQTVVSDETGLTAKYDFTVTYAGGEEPGVARAEAAEPRPDLFAALRGQLGLELEKKKVGVEVLVIEHMERVPRGN